MTRRIRVIPTLLIDGNGGLIKTTRFSKRVYIGDPINAVKLFNEKGADELIILDVDATRNRREPNYALIEEIAGEAFMPVGYGGGIRNLAQMDRILRSGLEKVVVSTLADEEPSVLRDAAEKFGSQSVVVCLDVKKGLLGDRVLTRGLRKSSRLPVLDAAKQAVENGAGEIIVHSVDREGTFSGYDISLVRSICDVVDVPVIALGGARSFNDFRSAVADAGSSAVAAGSFFVYQGLGRGVLISYPSEPDLETFYRSLAQ